MQRKTDNKCVLQQKKIAAVRRQSYAVHKLQIKAYVLKMYCVVAPIFLKLGFQFVAHSTSMLIRKICPNSSPALTQLLCASKIPLCGVLASQFSLPGLLCLISPKIVYGSRVLSGLCKALLSLIIETNYMRSVSSKFTRYQKAARGSYHFRVKFTIQPLQQMYRTQRYIYFNYERQLQKSSY